MMSGCSACRAAIFKIMAHWDGDVPIRIGVKNNGFWEGGGTGHRGVSHGVDWFRSQMFGRSLSVPWKAVQLVRVRLCTGCEFIVEFAWKRQKFKETSWFLHGKHGQFARFKTGQVLAESATVRDSKKPSGRCSAIIRREKQVHCKNTQIKRDDCVNAVFESHTNLKNDTAEAKQNSEKQFRRSNCDPSFGMKEREDDNGDHPKDQVASQ